MKKFLSTILVTVSLFMQAGIVSATETPALTWTPGVIMLADQRVLSGEIVIQAGYDLVLFRDKDGLMVYPAHLLRTVLSRDAESNVKKTYVSQVITKKGIKTFSLYEVCIQGEINILRKQKINRIFPLAETFDFDYFILTDNTILDFDKFKKMVYPKMLETCKVQLDNYMEEKRLDLDHDIDKVLLIEFYNCVYSSGEVDCEIFSDPTSSN